MDKASGAIATDFILDSGNLIREVGGDWDRFALKNGAPELTGVHIIGRSLLDFVTGNVTRQFLLALLHVVREDRSSIELEYRCDSPLLRRYMLMQVSRAEDGNLRFQHSVLRIEPRDRVVSFKVAPQRGRDTHVRCSMCNRIKALGDWVEPDIMIRNQKSQNDELAVIYGICESCKAELEKLTELTVR